MWTIEFKDKKYNTLLRLLDINNNSCLAAVKSNFELRAKNIILPDKAVKIWFCYNGERQATCSVKDFRFKTSV